MYEMRTRKRDRLVSPMHGVSGRKMRGVQGVRNGKTETMARVTPRSGQEELAERQPGAPRKGSGDFLRSRSTAGTPDEGTRRIPSTTVRHLSGRLQQDV